MDYILTHRKTAVAEIEIDDETAAISKIGAVFAPEQIPVGISLNNNRPNRGDLNDWWHGRGIPASRQNIRRAMGYLGVSSAGKLIIKCFGLSLSDQYWVNPITNPLVWENINFFDNPFSEDVGNILFGGLAPLFDNGSSFWYDQTVPNVFKAKSQPFFDTHEEQIKLVKDFSWLCPADLKGIDEEFNELLRKSSFIDNARRDALCFALRRRAERLLGYTCV